MEYKRKRNKNITTQLEVKRGNKTGRGRKLTGMNERK